MNFISEFDLIREVLFALQGLNGRIIRQDVQGRFTITSHHATRIDPVQRILVEKLTGFGWLVKKIGAFNKDPAQGKVVQCLAAALQSELLEYYNMVTHIEQQLQKCQSDYHEARALRPTATYEIIPSTTEGYNGGPDYDDDGFSSQMGSSNNVPVTLHQIHVWSLDHYFRLKTLAMLVECCQGARGGHLARIVYRFMQQGDKQTKAIITRILSQILLPIRQMLSQWIFHGEIQDPYDEFFICLGDHDHLTSSVTMMSLSTSTPLKDINATIPANHTHHRVPRLPISASIGSLASAAAQEKNYVINDYMMPGFISRQQANKILATGKAIHLLRKICADSNSVPGYEDLKKSFESTNIESLFRSQRLINCGEENEFEHLLNTAYKEVSQKALELLFGNFKLRSHFRGLRQYLLLGQGDFIRHLMDLLQSELDKPASECRFHNMFSVLESAMRSTNAQFDDPDVVSRIDCRLLDPAASPVKLPSEPLGWDVFTLNYKIDGPISTIFTDEKVKDYMEIFRRLWRTKRIEHVLTSLWLSQTSYTKLYFTQMPSSVTVFQRSNILLSIMIHFMQHFQNYIMFEVVECSWMELSSAIESAKDVDDIIAAHDNYLAKIKAGTQCQNDSLFDCILEFQQLMLNLYKDLDSEFAQWSDAQRVRNLSVYQSKLIIISKNFKSS